MLPYTHNIKIYDEIVEFIAAGTTPQSNLGSGAVAEL
jgi:hypothetical protein